jgi:precorrin-4 C11-methyltransferase
MNGMVHFVGAGSGAADLITVRGKRLLEEADMIIYAGSLVNPALLENAKQECEIHDSSRLHLRQVVELMTDAVRQGKTVVRLHTGDPSVYGAVREQMDRLDEAGIKYDVCPGVSSFCGAAATLKKEYTLPGVSQTLILTRMEGRTPVPERERIRSLAAHGSSMAVFLSASMLGKLQSELLAGGVYTEQTPCAIVYKATWPDEIKIETTLGSLAEKAAEAGITKTALILVGGFLGDEYELSKLYDASFSTEFRKADIKPVTCGRRVINAAVICYTKKGNESAVRIADALRTAEKLAVNIEIYRFEKNAENKSPNGDTFLFSDTKSLMADIMPEKDAVIFVSAAGIAVRSIAPYVNNKVSDAAVVVVNDNLDYVIPILSGHIGGANLLAETIASGTGAEAAVTTASDSAGIMSVDMYAQENGFAIEDMQAAKIAASELLKGKAMEISHDERQSILSIGDTQAVLRFLPYVIGIGCRKNTSPEKLSGFVREILERENISVNDIWKICSIDIKSSEKAISALASELGVPFFVFSADELKNAEGDFQKSDFVEKVTGVDNVCERSAAAGCSGSFRLKVKKQTHEGMTIAIGERYEKRKA